MTPPADKPMYQIKLPITAHWTPRPDITAHELAILLPYLLGKPVYEEDWDALGEATRHLSSCAT